MLLLLSGCGDGITDPGGDASSQDWRRQDAYIPCPTDDLAWWAGLVCTGKRTCYNYDHVGKYSRRVCKCADAGQWEVFHLPDGEPCGSWSGMMKWGRYCTIDFKGCTGN